MQLKRERDRLPRHTKGLREDLAKLIASVDGDAPWEACWQNGSTKTEKTDKRTMTKLTSFMVVAVHANCPLVAGFLQWAGAGTFLNVPRKTTPLHAALEEGHLTLMETMIQNLGGSLYIPDAQNRLPKDMRNMTPALLMKLEKVSPQIYRSHSSLHNITFVSFLPLLSDFNTSSFLFYHS